MFTFLITLGIISVAIGTSSPPPSLPPPTGKYNVGIKKFTIPYLNTNDPVWPTGVSTEMIATIFYPTFAKPSSKNQPYLDPVTAQLYNDFYQFKNHTLSSITANFLIKNARPLKKSAATILFGPGGLGPPVEVYTTLLSDLASHGYTVIGLDHVYEMPFVRYPNGTGVYGLGITYPLTLELVEATQEFRIKDTIALIDYLPTLSKKFGASINQKQIGAFGHSVGGAAAVGSQLKDQRILSTINLDGTYWGELGLNSSALDTKRPTLLFGQELHLGDDEDSDATWGAFRIWQTGWWRQILVKGALHLDFSDATFWKTFPPWVASSFGVIDGKRMGKIDSAIVKAFFDFTLLGQKRQILDASSKYPELVYYAGGNGTA